jgi:spermidine synthase
MQDLHYIKDEMLTHVPICTHANPKSLLIVGGCEKLQGEAKKHKSIVDIVRIDGSKASDEVSLLDENRFDIIIVAVDEMASDRVFWGLLNRTLKSDGVISTTSSRLLTQIDDARAELETIGEIFKIVMPYRYEASAHGTGLSCRNLILASHTYHPTADINLQRADLTNGFKYYNSDIAIGTFHLPTVIRQEFLGLIKL